MFCLSITTRQLRLIGRIGAVSPVTDDNATALKLVGRDCLIMGTAAGLIILLQIQPTGHMSVTRVLREHGEHACDGSGITELHCYWRPVSSLFTFLRTMKSESGRTPQNQSIHRSGRKVATYGEPWQMQNNRSLINESTKDEISIR